MWSPRTPQIKKPFISYLVYINLFITIGVCLFQRKWHPPPNLLYHNTICVCLLTESGWVIPTSVRWIFRLECKLRISCKHSKHTRDYYSCWQEWFWWSGGGNWLWTFWGDQVKSAEMLNILAWLGAIQILHGHILASFRPPPSTCDHLGIPLPRR